MGHLVVKQEPKDSILQSSITGALEGPGKAVTGFWDGAKAIWGILSSLPDPKARQELMSTWSRMSPKEKQSVYDGLTEMAGGALGGAVGGTLGTPIPVLGNAVGAGVGAGTGASVARVLSRLIGRYANPEAFKDATPEGEARDLMSTYTGYGTLEGLGRSVSATAKAGKSTIGPTEEAAKIAAKGKKMGMPPRTLGSATGKKGVQVVESGLADFPLSSGPIMKAKATAQAAFESALDRFMSEYHPDRVGPEGFQSAVEKAMEDARSAFQAEMRGKTEAAAGRFGPRKTAVEAGKDLRSGLLDNQKMLQEWANKAYPGVFKRADAAHAIIDTSSLGEGATDILSQIPDDIKSLVLNPSTKRTLRDVENLRPAANIDGSGLQRVNVNPDTGEMATQLRFEQGHKLRKALREKARSTPNPEDRARFYRLADTLDTEMMRAAESSGDEGLADALRAVDGKFARGAQATRGPHKRINPNGNPMARAIETTGKTEPETLASNVVKNPSRIANAEIATGNSTIPDAVGEGAPRSGHPAMESVRRVEADRLLSGKLPSEIRNNLTNPEDAERLRALFGGRLDDLVGDMNSAVPRENKLYNSKLARKLDRVDPASSDEVMKSAFPGHNAEASADTLDIMGGNRGIGQRAYAERLVDESTKTGSANRLTGDVVNPHVDPKRLGDVVADAGETVPSVLGKEGAGKLGDMAEVARNERAPELLYGNTSRTATKQALFNIMKTGGLLIPSLLVGHPGSAKQLGAAALTAGATWGAGKLMTSPRVIDWALKPAVASGTGQFSRGGAAIRAIAGSKFANPAANKGTDEYVPEGAEEYVPAGAEEYVPQGAEEYVPPGAEEYKPAVPAGKLRRQ